MYDITIIWVDKPSSCFRNVDSYQIEHNCIAVVKNEITATVIPLNHIREIQIEAINKQQ